MKKMFSRIWHGKMEGIYNTYMVSCQAVAKGWIPSRNTETRHTHFPLLAIGIDREGDENTI